MIELDIIQKARNADILAYLLSQGYRLVKSSPKEFRLEVHDSLVISNNRWHWFSRDIGGNTLDFLIKYEGKNFNEAVSILTGCVLKTHTARTRDIFISDVHPYSKNKNPVELILPPKAKDYHRVFAYLNKTRKIDSSIINDMMHQGKIYQSDRNNCVFTGTDKESNIRFACERGTFTGISYRRDCPGSDKRFCFHMEGRSNILYTFEAPLCEAQHKGDYVKQPHMLSKHQKMS